MLKEGLLELLAELEGVAVSVLHAVGQEVTNKRLQLFWILGLVFIDQKSHVNIGLIRQSLAFDSFPHDRFDILSFLLRVNLGRLVYGNTIKLHVEYLNYKRGDLPITEDICDRIFNLPCYGEFTREEQDKVVKILENALQILYA